MFLGLKLLQCELVLRHDDLEHQLEAGMARTVVDRDEAELLLRAVGAHPAADDDTFALGIGACLEQSCHSDAAREEFACKFGASTAGGYLASGGSHHG